MLTELSTDVPVEGEPSPPINSYKYHPIANKLPLLEGSEFAALVEDIRAHGLNEPIVLYEDMILEGRNRDRACREAGIVPSYWTKVFADHAAATAYVISANVHRRHLTSEQKRKLIEEMLISNPEQSNRQVARIVGSSPTTAGEVRKDLEEKGAVSILDTHTDSKGREQPARKQSKSEKALAEFKGAVQAYVPKMDKATKQKAVEYLMEYITKRPQGDSK